MVRLRLSVDEQSNCDGVIFFAGEACSEGVNACVHGAMDTGDAAAANALRGIAKEAKSKPTQEKNTQRSRL